MSAPLVLTSDGCEFSNYFSDNIKVVEDSEVALVKACLSIPVFAQQYVTIPAIPEERWDEDVLEFILDGLTLAINWRDIWEAWIDSNKELNSDGAADPGPPIILNVGIFDLTIEHFFNGRTQIPLNNSLIFTDNSPDSPTYLKRLQIPTLSYIFANHLDNNAEIYSINSIPASNFNNLAPITNSAMRIVGAGGPGPRNYLVDCNSVEDKIGLQAKYLPISNYAVSKSQVIGTTYNWVDINNTIVAPSKLNEIRGTVVGTDPISYDGGLATLSKIDAANIDWNGGTFQFEALQMSSTGGGGGRMIVGFSQDGNTGNVTGADASYMKDSDFKYAVKFIQVITTAGIKQYYEIIENGISTRIIDLQNGHLHDEYEIVPQNPNKTFITQEPIQNPPTPADNLFFLRIVRTGDISPTNRHFTFQLWGGKRTEMTGGSYFRNPKNYLIHQSNYEIANPQGYGIFFATNNNVNKIVRCSIIPVTDESRKQINNNTQASGLNNPTGIDVVSVAPVIATIDSDYTTDIMRDITNFYKGIGMPMRKSYDQQSSQAIKSSYNGLNFTLEIERSINQAQIYYYLGKNDVSDIIEFGYDPTIAMQWRFKPTLQEMPRFIDVKLNDLPINSYAGSYAKGGQNFTTSSITKDVCSIPVPAEYLELENNFNMDISYEPYNLVYRQLNNVADMPINQLQSELSFKDFLTNKLYKIPDINGTLKLEFHLRKHHCG
tara:strand:+ start:1384 stop:3534 length:2151 start_codon:yes stop_codon:yes gene_type:complete